MSSPMRTSWPARLRNMRYSPAAASYSRPGLCFTTPTGILRCSTFPASVAARIGAVENARSPDIYHSTQVTRQIYAIRAVIKPGNSGGPLLSPNGKVDGVVFAAAVSVPETGYALTAAEVASDASAGAGATAPVSTGLCD